MARPVDLSTAKPFLFERSFDESLWDEVSPKGSSAQVTPSTENSDETSEEDQDVPPPPTFTEEELATAKQDAYMDGHADGFREGHAESMDTLEARLVEMLDRLTPMVSALGAEQALANERAQINVARIVKALTAKLLPVYARKHGDEEILSVAMNCIAELQDAGRLTIRLCEDTTDDLGNRLTQAAERAGFDGTLRILPDPSLGPSDILVDWGAGSAERVYESIEADVENAIDRAIAAAEADLGAVSAETSPQSDTHDAETNDSSIEVEAPSSPSGTQITLEDEQSPAQETPLQAQSDATVDAQHEEPN